MRRLPSGFLPVLFALVALSAGSLAVPPATSAATIIAATTTCSNGVDNTPGLGLICEVTIVNSITESGGSAVVTVRECHGSAGDPTAACTVVTSILTSPVTLVDQCNDATNGGGGTLRCSVDVTNEFIGVTPGASAVTINQCVGSGDGISIGCDPFPATTSGAVITQCNGSANGGTLVGLTCTASGSQASALGVTVNQCNGSTNGGGGLVICSVSITYSARSNPPRTPVAGPIESPVQVPAPPSASPSATPATAPTASPVVVQVTSQPVVVPAGGILTPLPTLPPTATAIEPPARDTGGPAFALVVLFAVALTVLGVASRQSRRRTGAGDLRAAR